MSGNLPSVIEESFDRSRSIQLGRIQPQFSLHR